MAAEDKRRNLGRGLSALLGEETADYAQLDKVRASKVVPIEFVHPGRFQPRNTMHQDKIKDLADSIRSKGILQPLLVRRHPEEPNGFEIIAGERRWRAAQLAQLHEIPVIVKDLNDQEVLEVALVENLQRQDLSPLEEAEGYSRLMEEFSNTQEKLAKAVGKSRSHVANSLRLLGLPDAVKDMLEKGHLSAGHARALVNSADPEALARQVIRRGLNVRQTEKLAQGKAPTVRSAPPPPEKDADTLALERDLTQLLGLRVEIKFRGGGGSLTIHYGSLEQLDDILQRLSHAAAAAPQAATDEAATAASGDTFPPDVSQADEAAAGLVLVDADDAEELPAASDSATAGDEAAADPVAKAMQPGAVPDAEETAEMSSFEADAPATDPADPVSEHAADDSAPEETAGDFASEDAEGDPVLEETADDPPPAEAADDPASAETEDDPAPEDAADDPAPPAESSEKPE